MPSSQSEVWPLRIWVKNLPSGVLEWNLCSGGWTHHLWKAERRVLLVCPLPGEVLFSIPPVPLLPSAAGSGGPESSFGGGCNSGSGSLLGSEVATAARSAPRCHRPFPPVLSLSEPALKARLLPQSLPEAGFPGKPKCPVICRPDTSPGAPRPLSTQGLDVRLMAPVATIVYSSTSNLKQIPSQAWASNALRVNQTGRP